MSGTVSGKYYGGATRTLTQGATTELAVDVNGALKISGNTSSGAVYNVTPPVYADGASAVAQADVNGNLKVVEQFAPAAEDNTNGVEAVAWKPIAANTYAPSLASALGAGTLIAKAGAGNIYGVSATNRNAAIRYLQIHNKATAVANPDVPLISIPVPVTAGNVTIGPDLLTLAGVACSIGVQIGMSTTSATYTAATAGEHDIFVTYK